MGEATQALCFLAGANSIFTGDKLLTAANAGDDKDAALFAKLGLKGMAAEAPALYPGLEPGSRRLSTAARSATPGQARGDEVCEAP